MLIRNGVDLALWAHEHAYERAYPVRNGTVVQYTTDNPPVPVHVLIGMGGADNSYMPGWIEPPPPWVAHREMTFGHARITLLSESVLHFEYAAVDGAIHDEFFLSKVRTAGLKEPVESERERV